MDNFFSRLFNKSKIKLPNRKFTDEEFNADYEAKSKGLENILGKMHGLVGHAIIPFEIGGAVDMYYFTDHISGTGFATMELLEPDGSGPKPNKNGTYELVAFTKHDYLTSDDPKIPFNLIERRICNIFTTIGHFSKQAILNPLETCEVPNDEGLPNICLVFDKYQPDNKEFKIGKRNHHLLLCLQVFRTEMEFARTHGTEQLLKKLKLAGYYPYSDLDRETVV